MSPIWISRLIEQCERWAETAPLRFALAMNGTIFVLIVSIFRCAFQTNDDPTMAMIASGTCVGLAPDEHLIFTNVLIGLLLKGLYTVCGSIPWYGVYLVVTQFVSHTAVLYSLLVWRYMRRHAELYYLFLATIGVFFLTNLQFTITAFYAVQSGLMLGLTGLSLRADGERVRARWMLVGSAALMLWGAMIRIDAFVGTALVGVPLALAVMWPLRKRGVVLPLVAWCATVIALVVGAQRFDAQYYQQDQSWQEFFTYNALRIKFNDYQWTHYDPTTKPIFDRVHWSDNDHEMLRNWYYDDARLYSAENLQTVLNSYDWAPKSSPLLRIGTFFVTLFQDHSLWPVLCFLPLYIWCAQVRRKTGILLAFSLSLTFVVLLLISIGVKQPPQRVYYPLLAFQLPLALFLGRCGPAPSVESTRQWLLLHLGVIRRNAQMKREFIVTLELSNALIPAAFLLLAVYATIIIDVHEYRWSVGVNKYNTAIRRALKDIGPHDDELFVNWGGTLQVENISPFERPQVFKNFHMLLLGWTQRTPFHEAMKAHFQINDLTSAIVARKDIFLISSEELNEYFETFIKEHHAADLRWKNCYTCMQFLIWKPVLASSPEATLPPSISKRDEKAGIHFRRL